MKIPTPVVVQSMFLVATFVGRVIENTFDDAGERVLDVDVPFIFDTLRRGPHAAGITHKSVTNGFYNLEQIKKNVRGEISPI